MSLAEKIKVLIVDDQVTSRLLLSDALTQLGFKQITAAGDGEQGMKIMEQQPHHLVISDFNMPKMDGLGLLQAVRTNPNTKKAAFIILTAQGDLAWDNAPVARLVPGPDMLEPRVEILPSDLLEGPHREAIRRRLTQGFAKADQRVPVVIVAVLHFIALFVGSDVLTDEIKAAVARNCDDVDDGRYDDEAA